MKKAVFLLSIGFLATTLARAQATGGRQHIVAVGVHIPVGIFSESHIAGTGASYSWTGPGSYSATLQNTNRVNSTAGMTGWYKMLVGLNGCTYTDSTYATIHPIPAVPNISYSNPLCVGETLNLGTATVSGASYSWTGRR